jgi:hypothetical protein
MKGLKLSKASWLILSAGVFIVILAGLGLTRSQQLNQQTELDKELSQSEKSLAAMQTAQLSQKKENLKVQIEDNQSQMKEAQVRLHKTVISVDVSEAFFKIAADCSVNVTNISTTTIAQTSYEGIAISTISLSGRVIGEKKNIIKFVIALNDDFVTGNIASVQIVFSSLTDEGATTESGTGTESGTETGTEAGAGTGTETGAGDMLAPGTADASISMLIYSYEG